MNRSPGRVASRGSEAVLTATRGPGRLSRPSGPSSRPAAPGRSGALLGRFVRNPAAVVGALLVGTLFGVGFLAPWLAPGQSFSFDNPLLAPPSWRNPMGTDQFSRDMLKAVMQGLHTSMLAVVSVTSISTAIGVTLGLVAGWQGGAVDALVTRSAELLGSLPRFVLAMMVVGLYGAGLDRIILLLGLTSWAFLARIVRAETLSVRGRAYVEAARAAGARSRRMILSHVLPAIAPRAAVVVVLMGSRVILIEAGLAFLGLADTQTPSLGVLASNAQNHLLYAWWLWFFPGLALAGTVLGLNLLSDGLTAVLDPAAKSAHTDNKNADPVIRQADEAPTMGGSRSRG
ncbi:MAG: ABC transporter permease [Acidimicrobiales bacterium]